ncbi:MAG: methionine--tRNA ligase, partial [Silvibacterium sp.]|nr:methionine--tRNA ligase [Silvibacterium sp.]
MSNKFYLTTPIYYVNARPHIGTTYTTVIADVIACRKRALGVDTFFLTGTDEHGQKIQRSAEKANCSAQEFTDRVAAQFRALWDRMGLTYDDFIRTTDPRHKRGVQKLFSLLQQRGYIYKGSYTGQYCVSDEAYVDVPPGAPCPECGRITETVNEENYFFKLSAFERPLLELYENNPDFIRPETRRNEVISFVKAGLKDLSVSRTSFKWGVPFPGDEKHVIYVWADALANYITAIGYGSDDPADQAKFEKYWPADLHLVGKEITRFHCVYWPAFLMAAGLPMPKSVVANGWLLFEENKMSKSRGNVVRSETILDVLGADALRYFLLREIVFGHDGSFSFDALVQRYNADLANGYGNLVSRTLTMIGKYFDGVVPEPVAGQADSISTEAPNAIAAFNRSFDALDFSRALETAWAMVAAVDGYLTASAPWKQPESVTDGQQRALRATVLYTAAEAIRIITALVYPVIPDAAAKVWGQLGLGDIHTADLRNLTWGGLPPGTRLGEFGPVFPRAEKDAITRMQQIEQSNNSDTPAVPAENTLGEPFGALAATPVETQGLAVAAAEEAAPPSISPAAPAAPAPSVPVAVAKGGSTQSAAPSSDKIISEKITIDDFAKVDLRVAKIMVAERVPKADKLLRLEVDLGYEQRQILAGIAEAYTPESLVGRKVVIVANLAPRKLRGLE